MAVPAGVLGSGCCGGRTPASHPVALETVGVDVHCHMFNAADLPVNEFLLGVVLRKYYDAVSILKPVEAYLTAKVSAALVGLAPGYDEEMAFLSGRPGPDPLDLCDQHLAALLSDALAPTATPIGPIGVAAADLEGQRRKLGDLLRPALRMAPGDARAALAAPERASQALIILDETNELAAEVANVLRWTRKLSDYRLRIIDTYFELFGQERLGMSVIAPAMVDFERWLPTPNRNRRVVRVSMERQVEIMKAIMSRRPFVHPFVGIDPMRPWDETKELLDDCFSHEDGSNACAFAGVKLYPPLGYSVSNNAHLDASSAGLSTFVNENLQNLFTYCLAHDVPVMAHCNDTNTAALSQDGRTAMPREWIPVVAKYPLRINLAHMAGLRHFADGKEFDDRAGLIGKMMDGAPLDATGSRAVADVYTDMADEESARDAQFRGKFLAQLRSFFAAGSARSRRFMFGTDWDMLGVINRFETFLGDWFETMQEGLRESPSWLTNEHFEGFFGKNAIAFLGLNRDGKAARRFEAHYERLEQRPWW